ncbi:MAG: aldo/keto reductase [Sandaracinaceae bacterium]
MNELAATLPLRHGGPIPIVGLGVFRAGSGRGTQDAVRWALARGYRHIDTAHIYRNEVDVGEALARSEVPRDEVFVTTKLWNDDHGYDPALAAVEASLAALKLDYVDLYLVHWPLRGKRVETWRAMERVLELGYARAIGVSNYMVRHLDELEANAKVLPAVNQIELHPFCQQRDTVAWCRARDILVEAYSPLTKGKKLDDPTLAAIGRARGRTPAQILLRWSIQKGYVPLPKSADPSRIDENASVFDFALNEAEMSKLEALEQDLHTAWNPNDEP